MEENYFLAKWLNNELSPEELADFKKNPDYKIYVKIKENTQNLAVKNFDEEKILQRVLAAKKQEAKYKIFNPQNFYKMVAAFAILVGMSFLFYYNFSTKTYSTNANSSKTLYLPDLSKIVLNANSEVNYQSLNWNKRRNINLDGSAYFHVAKGNKFTVSTDLGKVRVLGTQFEVKSINNKFEVICYDGKVKVNYKEKEIILTKNRQVIFENGNQTNSVIHEKNPYEKDLYMVFKDERLENIIKELENNYQVKIVLEAYSKELFTGKLPSDNLDLALSIIASTYNLEYKNNNKDYILFSEKK